jgi:hypothetical protein
MAYNTEDLFKIAIDEVEKKKLVFHADVLGILGISTSTYYDHFPKESKEYKDIERALKKNVIAIKAGIRNKWYKSKSDMGGLYLYKLIGDKDERERLSVNYNKNDHSGEIDLAVRVNTANLSMETLKELDQAYEQSAKDNTESPRD